MKNSSEQVRMDEQAALAALDGKRELLCELASLVCEDCPQLLVELRQAIESGDASRARRITHSLKGLTATFYAYPTIDIAHRLEYEAAMGRLQPFIDGGLEQLATSVALLIDQLKTRGLIS